MNLKYNNIPKVFLLLLVVLVTSCKDDIWDSHYNDKMLTRSDKTVYEYLKSRSDLSIFTHMCEKLGYDSLLSTSMPYTVWAPLDSSLANVDLNDTSAVRKIVTNHITYFSYPTSSVSTKSKSILMLDNKLLLFSAQNSGYNLDNKLIAGPDVAMKNGIVHVLGGYVGYKRNFWEYITETSGLDSLRKYINSLTQLELDNAKSYNNNVLVDSIFKSTNYVFDNIAALKTEDSIYTGILPDNSAWTTAYNKIFPYFKTQIKDGGVEIQDYLTKKMMIDNLFFRGVKSFPLSPDSITSTIGTTFYQADRLFAGSNAQEMSNGYGYVTSQLKDEPSDYWLKPIKIEAENYATYGGQTSNYTVSTISSIGTKFTTVSGRNFLNLVDASTSSLATLFARFPIPNNLSTKYNIYCVFVPGAIVDTADLRPYKVKFNISYTNSAGTLLSDVVVDANNSTATKTQATFTTDPTIVHKMLVLKNFELPFRYNKPTSATTAEYQKSITLSLKVTNATAKTSADMAKYNRNLRIDCIILEPVQ